MIPAIAYKNPAIANEYSFARNFDMATKDVAINPTALALDSAGNIFIVDTLNNRILKAEADGDNLSRVAGDGVLGFRGDGSSAIKAKLDEPEGVVVDKVGNIFIADALNDRIRRVDARTGIITTVAGNGSFNFSGDGGLATEAGLGGPGAIALDSNGNLFLATDNRIRRVDSTSGIITTVAGNGKPGFNGDERPAINGRLNFPRGIAIDKEGNIFIADSLNNRIRKVDVNSGIITTVAGNDKQGFGGDGGPATSAELFSPEGVAVNNAGDLFIADTVNNRIRRIDGSSGIITTIAGDGKDGFSGDGGSAVAASLSNPRGVAIDDMGNLFIADTDNNRIRRVGVSTGIITTIVGSNH
jgi:sugar lactone lactonase YvrE